MDLKDILSIAGKPGLFKNIGQAKSGVIVESLIDGKRFPAFAHERISSLAEISVFTYEDDIPLNDVFKKIYEKFEGKEGIDPKASGKELKAFMKEVLPDYDEDRVYTSDIKKMVSWYNLLLSKGMVEFTEEEEEKEEEKPNAGENSSESEEKPLNDKTTEADKA